MLDERDFMSGNYQERRADLENEISNYMTAISSMTTQINNSMTRVLKKESENLGLSEKVTKLKTKVRTTLDSQDTEINRLKDRLEELRESFDSEEYRAMNLLESRLEMKAFMESSKELQHYRDHLHGGAILGPSENKLLEFEKIGVGQIKTHLLKNKTEKDKLAESFKVELDETYAREKSRREPSTYGALPRESNRGARENLFSGPEIAQSTHIERMPMSDNNSIDMRELKDLQNKLNVKKTHHKNLAIDLEERIKNLQCDMECDLNSILDGNKY
jgi:hypothetical protein